MDRDEPDREIDIAFVETEGFADPHPGSKQQANQRRVGGGPMRVNSTQARQCSRLREDRSNLLGRYDARLTQARIRGCLRRGRRQLDPRAVSACKTQRLPHNTHHVVTSSRAKPLERQHERQQRIAAQRCALFALNKVAIKRRQVPRLGGIDGAAGAFDGHEPLKRRC